MNPGRWQRIREIFDEAVERDTEDVTAFLDSACAGDATLRAEVEGLLRQDSDADEERFLDPDTLPASTGAESESSLVGQSLGRYSIIQKLGRGGMGVVYLAQDTSRGERVALKTLLEIEPAALYRFKREFRSLADVTHPNLVTLYELVGDESFWFFTMEHIVGDDFLSHVRGGGRIEFHDIPSTVAGHLPDDLAQSVQAKGTDPVPTAHADRLREALRQLASGLSALHELGGIHRDIKPSNILVEKATGRVVLLDFGLAAEVGAEGLHRTTAPNIMGTVAYMSPEQAGGHPVSSASDWYSVGVTLFEALTGQLPFTGNVLEVLRNKQMTDAPDPRDLVGGLPDDLAELCVALIRREPSSRPTGKDILDTLQSNARVVPTGPDRDVPFVGREEQLGVLRRAYDSVLAGGCVTVHVRGRSGMGKTALVRHFLEGLGGSAPIVLSGRCYQRESVPYKALDSLVDSLSRYLGRCTPDEVRAVLPRDVAALMRVFPVLARVTSIHSLPQRSLDGYTDREIRRRGGLALRELLARLGDSKPLVAFIDDVQWGDVDSATLLGDLLAPPDSPVLLLALSYRSEAVDTSPFLKEFFSVSREWACSELEVTPLARTESEQLARHYFGHDDMGATLTDEVAREAGGSPLFVYELVRHHEDKLEAPSEEERVSNLDEVLWQRIERLPEEARRLLETVAVAAHPLRESDACAASGVRDRSVLALLETSRLLRSAGGEANFLEAYHDRIRETTVAHLDVDVVRDHHRRLGEILEQWEQVDPEVLAVHFQESGSPGKAVDYFRRAAQRAHESLAFDHAAALSRQTLELMGAKSERKREVQLELADALADSGRGAEAARHYLACVEGCERSEQLRLRQLAAQHLLCSGHVEKGLAIYQTLLDQIGMRISRTNFGALVSILWQKLRLWWRGWDFEERPESECSADELLRLDTCHSITLGLSQVSSLRSFDFHFRETHLALTIGEPMRVLRSMIGHTIYHSVLGSAGRAKAESMLAKCRELAGRDDTPMSRAWMTMLDGHLSYWNGHWKEALDNWQRAEDIFRGECSGASWELHMVSMFRLSALYYLGRVKDLSTQIREVVREAQDCGNRLQETNQRVSLMSFVVGMERGAEAALEEVDTAVSRWKARWSEIQEGYATISRLHIRLFQGLGREAVRLLDECGGTVEDSLLIKIQVTRAQYFYLRACSYLALACELSGSEAESAVARSEKELARLEKEGLHWTEPLALMGRACVATHRGDNVGARELVSRAEQGLLDANMMLFAMVARRRRGQLLGGEEGAGLVEYVGKWMAEEGITDVESVARMFAPGRWPTTQAEGNG